VCDRLGNPMSLAQRLARAHTYRTRFCCLLCTGSVGYPSDMTNLRHLYEYLDRAIPADVEQAIMYNTLPSILSKLPGFVHLSILLVITPMYMHTISELFCVVVMC